MIDLHIHTNISDGLLTPKQVRTKDRCQEKVMLQIL